VTIGLKPSAQKQPQRSVIFGNEQSHASLPLCSSRATPLNDRIRHAGSNSACWIESGILRVHLSSTFPREEEELKEDMREMKD
jgi:hypothetical protein